MGVANNLTKSFFQNGMAVALITGGARNSHRKSILRTEVDFHSSVKNKISHVAITTLSMGSAHWVLHFQRLEEGRREGGVDEIGNFSCITRSREGRLSNCIL